ncbi:hypothetical protein EJ110_NYTH23158 [Nymphaea thermarum]|nr:hypothetical protein EJ110_NYTH23158 [Nymphaea thermarum]
MCPLRIILVFLSASLAGYFAWKSIRSEPDEDSGELVGKTPETTEESACSIRKFPSMMVKAFWVFVDMASGKYLWRNLRSGAETAKKES